MKWLVLLLLLLPQTSDPPTSYPQQGPESAITPEPQCEDPLVRPTMTIFVPSTGAIPGTSILTSITASDTGGVDFVDFWWEYCPEPGFVCQGKQFIGQVTNPAVDDGVDNSRYEKTWTFPSCGAAPNNQKFTFWAMVRDVCGRTSVVTNNGFQFVDDLALNGRGC